jgi:two-component system, chemotaxis family, protein-glutamate methylesterase/glutaminase
MQNKESIGKSESHVESLRYKAVVIGLSAGGMQALKIFVPAIPASFPLPIAVAQHVGEDRGAFLAEYLNEIASLPVKEAEDKEPLCPGHIYLAPARYHLLIEEDRTFSLSVDPRVKFCCPAIDVLFESAADAFGKSLIGVVLTGANGDGSHGLKTIKARGGLAIVQNPATAEVGYMPRAALGATTVDRIVELEELAPLLTGLGALRSKKECDAIIGS